MFGGREDRARMAAARGRRRRQFGGIVTPEGPTQHVGSMQSLTKDGPARGHDQIIMNNLTIPMPNSKPSIGGYARHYTVLQQAAAGPLEPHAGNPLVVPQYQSYLSPAYESSTNPPPLPAVFPAGLSPLYGHYGYANTAKPVFSWPANFTQPLFSPIYRAAQHYIGLRNSIPSGQPTFNPVQPRFRQELPQLPHDYPRARDPKVLGQMYHSLSSPDLRRPSGNNIHPIYIQAGSTRAVSNPTAYCSLPLCNSRTRSSGKLC